VVHGVIPHEHGTIAAPIGRDPSQRQQMGVIHTNSKPAVTHFTVRERFAQTTMVECRLETGRTHQIRVHMKYIGFPLVGDPVYGPKKNPYPIHGQALHAKVLGFTHPRTAERIRIEAELPQEMEELITSLRGG
jgi:23S rRNA pseudouridine1911/1915/1917 synthase